MRSFCSVSASLPSSASRSFRTSSSLASTPVRPASRLSIRPCRTARSRVSSASLLSRVDWAAVSRSTWALSLSRVDREV